MKKFFQIAVLGALLMAPACGMAQETHVDVHVGANLSGFVGGNDSQVQDKKVRVGSEFGVGLSYETKNKIVLSSGFNFLLVSNKMSVLSDYLSEGKLAFTYPEVNAKEIALEVPVKIGYDFRLGTKLNFIPSIGVYGRYSTASLKDDVTENFVGDIPNTFKWNCFENHLNNNNRLDAYKRWDVGALVEAKFLYAGHYSLLLGYSRGFIKKSSQFKVKNHSLKLTIGYSF